jgi:hypothetical protein
MSELVGRWHVRQVVFDGLADVESASSRAACALRDSQMDSALGIKHRSP